MRSHFVLTLRVPNPLYWWRTRHARREERASQRRIAALKAYLLEPEPKGPVRKTTTGKRANDRAPLAPYGWFRSGDPKEILDLTPERVIVREA